MEHCFLLRIFQVVMPMRKLVCTVWSNPLAKDILLAYYTDTNTNWYPVFVQILLLACNTDRVNKAISQSCAVPKSEHFWRATGQSNLAYKRLAATKASKVWFSYSHNCTLSNGAVFNSLCYICLSSNQPEIVIFSYHACL